MRPHDDRPRVGDRAMQIDAALLPVALHGPLRHAAHGGDLGEGEAAEELQIDDLREIRIDLAELVERIADPGQLLRVGHVGRQIGAERRNLEQAAALLRAPPPHVVDDQAAHHARGVGHEPRAIGEDRPFLARDREVGLVQQGRHPDGPGRSLSRQLAAGQPMELRVQSVEQGISGCTLIGQANGQVER